MTGLQPDTVYAVSFVTANVFGAELGLPATFRTLPETYVTDVSSSGVTLHAVLDPEGQPTTYRFEYGTSNSYGFETPESYAGAGSTAVAVEFHQQDLFPATTYHFRVLATSAGKAAESADGVFTTQATGEGFMLPDGRQWELVSPPDKEGGRLIPPSGEGVVQAAADGGAITYRSELSPTEAEPLGFTFLSQVFSVRGVGGWSSRDIDTPHDEPTGTPVGKGSEYRLFSSDLSLGLVEPFGDGGPPLSGKATERTAYVHDDAPLMPNPPSRRSTANPRRKRARVSGICRWSPPPTCPQASSSAEYSVKVKTAWCLHAEGATPDLSHVLFESEAPLTSKAIQAELGEELYEWSAGRLQLVSVLPGVAEEPMSGKLRFDGFDARNAISADGSRVFWSAGNGNLYMRVTAKAKRSSSTRQNWDAVVAQRRRPVPNRFERWF